VSTDIVPAALLRFNPSNEPLRRTLFDVLLDRGLDGKYTPSLAKSWEWSTDNKTLTIDLQDGVTFHSGRDLEADDVIFSLQTAMAPKSGVQVAGMLNRATGLKASSKSQIVVTFDTPFTSYLDALATIPIVDSKTWTDVASGKQMVGTGPFTWKSWTPGSTLTMGRNDSYWQSGKPHLDGIELRVIGEPQAMLAALQSGQLDLVNRLLAKDEATLQKDPRFTVAQSPGVDVYVGCSTQDKPLDDIRVRQGIAYAIDRDRIVKQVYSGFAKASACLWGSDTPGVTSKMVNSYAYNIDKAKSLFTEAGVIGTEIELAPSPQDPAFSAAADIVQYGLEQAGLKIKRVSVTSADWPTRNQAYNLPALWISNIGLSASGPVATLMAANPLTPDKNTSNFTTPEYTDKVNALLDAASDSAKETALADVTNYMIEQAFHNTFAQAGTPLVSVKGLTDVAVDLTMALKLADAKLAS